MDPLLRLTEITKDFLSRARGAPAAHRALDRVSLSLSAGETLAIVGGSGSGKSTLAKIAVGMTSVTSGSIELAGKDLRTYDRLQIARIVQTVFQDPFSSLNERRTVHQNVRLPLDAQGVAKSESSARVAEAIDLVRLPASIADRGPRELSGGQRQRVAIARALVTKPQILICDEPTSALDVSIQAEILKILVDIRRELGTAILFISHDLAVVASIASRVAVMSRGSVVEQGTVDEVIMRPRHAYTRELISSVPDMVWSD